MIARAARAGRWLFALAPVAVAVAVAAPVSDGQISLAGRYQVSLTPRQQPLPINAWLEWDIQVQRRDGAPVALRDLVLDGGMPAHGHGLPTAPVIVPTDVPGAFVAQGVRFNMPGRWELRVLAVDERGTDSAVFPVEVQAPPLAAGGPEPGWTGSERAVLRSLWIGSLPAPPPDPSNRVADDARAAAWGQRLFFDPGLSSNGHISCASCHQPRWRFSDGRRTGRGVRALDRNTPGLGGVAYAHWFYWDGRRDSAWAQALGPIESPAEMDATRVEVLRYIERDQLPSYRALFGALPDLAGLPRRASPASDEAAQRAWNAIAPARQVAITRAFVNVGKAIAAYERRLRPGVAPFDRYVEAVLAGDAEAARAAMSDRAVAGLKLFLSGDAQCLRCHNGPLFTNGGFHNIGTGTLDGEHPDFGRSIGIQALLASELHCLGPHSDDPTHSCPELAYLQRHGETGSLVGAFKVPSLRNAAATAPYMHDGRFATLPEAIAHYRHPAQPRAPLEFRPLFDMTPEQIESLAAFLRALDAPVIAPTLAGRSGP